jgi:hypothetical protein
MQLSGKIKKIGEDIPVNDTFRKRELVIVTDDQYPQTILIEFTQNNCDKLSSFKVGDNVIVSINIRGREYTKDDVTRYFNSIQGWRIETLDESNLGTNEPMDEDTDLPF